MLLHQQSAALEAPPWKRLFGMAMVAMLPDDHVVHPILIQLPLELLQQDAVVATLKVVVP